MIPVATAAQIRECDRETIEDLGLPGLVLMENASRSVAFKAIELLGGKQHIAGKKISIYCGKGNNGGDGFAAARHLQNVGALVDVFLIGEAKSLKGDALFNCKFLKKIDGKVVEILKLNDLVKYSSRHDLIIDALLGTGFQGEVRGLYAKVVEFINGFDVPVIAVDIPSGVEADSGKAATYAVMADATMTFGLMKRGLLLSPGREHAGHVTVVEIGIPPKVIAARHISLSLVEESNIRERIPHRHPAAHKGNVGHVYILAGSPGLTGAATLTAEAAMRIGSGLVVVGVPESLNPILEVKLNEAMSQPLPETKAGTLSSMALNDILPRMEWANVVVIGPGMRRDSDTAKLLERLLKEINKPLVIDADGLNLLADHPHLLNKLPADTVLTPHPGEFSRLTGISKSNIIADRFKAVSEWANKWNVTVVLKGSPTVTSTPEGKMFLNPTGNAGMASGGSGDALTGIIGGLIAQGLNTGDAAWVGVYLHGAAGDHAAWIKGIHGMVAGDIINYLPEVIKELS